MVMRDTREDDDTEFTVINKIAWDYKTYEYWCGKYGNPSEFCERIVQNPKQFLIKYLDFFDDLEGKSVLNFCGSNGKLALACTCLGANVTVVDISENGKRYAEEAAESMGIDLNYISADILDYESKNEFDISFSYIGVLHYFKDINKLFEKIYSLTAKGGYYLLSDFHPFLKVMFSEQERINGDYFDSTAFYGDMPYAKYFVDCEEEYPKCLYREYNLSEIINALIKSGFMIERFHELPFTNEKYPCEFIIKVRK